ncbi:MAG: hypothetical protein U0470_09280 [Anaerolineae bacterium]
MAGGEAASSSGRWATTPGSWGGSWADEIEGRAGNAERTGRWVTAPPDRPPEDAGAGPRANGAATARSRPRCSATFARCSSYVTAKACVPSHAALATKYIHGPSAGASTAWMATRPGLAIGPGGRPARR